MTAFPQKISLLRRAADRARSRRRRGFSLVEVLLAVAVLGMAILTIVGLLNAAFESVSSNLRTSQALTVYTRLDGALADVREFISPEGQALVSENDLKTKPSFDYVYEWLNGKNGTSWDDALFVVCFSRRVNPDSDETPQLVMQAIKADSSQSLPTKDDLDSMDFEGNVYLARVFVSPELEGARVEMNSRGEVLSRTHTQGGTLPSSPDAYARADLPVAVEIYPVAVGSARQSESQTPILSQMLVISR